MLNNNLIFGHDVKKQNIPRQTGFGVRLRISIIAKLTNTFKNSPKLIDNPMADHRYHERFFEAIFSAISVTFSHIPIAKYIIFASCSHQSIISNQFPVQLYPRRNYHISIDWN